MSPARPRPPAARVRLARVPHLAQTEVLQATYVSQVFPKHTHEEFAIGTVDGGVHVSEWDGATHVAGPGTIVVNNPGDTHTGRAGDPAGWSYRMLYPPAALLQDVAAHLGDRATPLPAFASPVLHDGETAAALGALVSAVLGGGEPLETETRFVEAIAQLLTRHAVERPRTTTGGVEPVAVRRVRDCLEAQMREGVSIATLGRVAELHPLSVVRAFRRATGLPPHAWLTQLRVRHAKALLAAGEPPAAVAAAIGFADQSHLHRHFVRLVGVRPGEYARAVRGARRGG